MQGKVGTWVNSQWKYQATLGQFSVAINRQCHIAATLLFALAKAFRLTTEFCRMRTRQRNKFRKSAKRGLAFIPSDATVKQRTRSPDRAKTFWFSGNILSKASRFYLPVGGKCIEPCQRTIWISIYLPQHLSKNDLPLLPAI